MAQATDSSAATSGTGPAPGGAFPETLWSVVQAASSPDDAKAAAALGRLCAMYRQPIFRWLCATGCGHHEAEDATQDFITHLLSRERLAPLTPGRARFRTWLLTCLRNYRRDQHQARVAAKRGGGAAHLDVSALDPASGGLALDLVLDREFARVVHERALTFVRSRWEDTGRRERFEALCPFVLERGEGGAYASTAEQLGLSPKQIKRAVFDLREQHIEAFRVEVAQTVAPEDLPEELRHSARAR
jgi:DNA-directed RNA polymerase specialized sigma24 family protein